MTWNLFIDDERTVSDVTWFPPRFAYKYKGQVWLLAKTYSEALELVHTFGMPSFISFDHDLGEDSHSGYEIAKELVDIDLRTTDPDYKFPVNFDIFVHSKNPVGKKNIEHYFLSYFKTKKE